MGMAGGVEYQVPAVLPRKAERDAALERKKLQWQICDLAVLYLQLDKTASYRDAARLLRVGIHQLRCRVHYRYGSLEELRAEGASTVKPRLVQRACMGCGKLVMLEANMRLCGRCKAG